MGEQPGNPGKCNTHTHTHRGLETCMLLSWEGQGGVQLWCETTASCFQSVGSRKWQVCCRVCVCLVCSTSLMASLMKHPLDVRVGAWNSLVCVWLVGGGPNIKRPRHHSVRSYSCSKGIYWKYSDNECSDENQASRAFNTKKKDKVPHRPWQVTKIVWISDTSEWRTISAHLQLF